MKKTAVGDEERVDIVRRTGNVFAQLGLPEADDLLRKARVLRVINEVIAERGLDQSRVAEILKIDQADVSRLAHGRVSRFSLDRLMTLVDRLGVAVDLHQERNANGHLIVTVKRSEAALP